MPAGGSAAGVVREDERSRRRQHAAHAVDQRQLGVRDLTGAAFAAKLRGGFDDRKIPYIPLWV